MSEMDQMLSGWKAATANLPAGVQHVLKDTLELVKGDDIHLVHSSDYSQGYPCLINSVAQMTQAGGGSGIPINSFPDLVSLFDRINSRFQQIPGYNDPSTRFVSPEVAEVLLHYFAPLKEQNLEEQINDATKTEAFGQGLPYREPKDEELMRDWINAMESEATKEEQRQSKVNTSDNTHRVEH